MAALELTNTYLYDDYNLQGYWRLESNTNDESRNGYTLTTSGSPSYAAAQFGNGISLVRTSNQYAYITHASAPNLEIAGSFTWVCWFKPTTNVDQRIIWKSGAGPIRGFYLSGGDGSLLFYCSGLTTNEYVDSGSSLSNGTMYMLTGIYDSALSKLKVFINKTKTEVTASGTPTSNTGDFQIGGEAGQRTNGLVDEVQVYNRALSDQEVSDLYDGLLLGRGGGNVLMI